MTRTGRHKWPTSNRNGGRLQIGAVADFVSESVAGFGGIRTHGYNGSYRPTFRRSAQIFGLLK